MTATEPSNKLTPEPTRIRPDATDRTYAGIPRMPALFGRQAGPRQRFDRTEGHPLDVGSATVTWVAAPADAEHLRRLLPKGFELAEPLLVVEAVTTADLPWLAGRGYELLTVSVPIVFIQNSNRVAGKLALVTWEDCPDAIISGREELGYNKVYADSMSRIESADGTSIRYTAGWGGTTFFDLDLRTRTEPPTHVTASTELEESSTWRNGPTFHYRVLPRTGEWGKLEVEQVTANSAPSAFPPGAISKNQSATGTFRFIPTTFDALPTLVHIVNTLAEIPLGSPVDAGSMIVNGWNDISDMRIVASWPVDPPEPHQFT